MNAISTVIKARKNTKSLRTTIPETVCEFLEISNKNELEWKMYTREGKKMAVVIKNI